jgi:hypothetical protein
VKDESCDLLADSHNILNRWKNYFSQLLDVHRVSEVRQVEIHTAESLVLDPSPFEMEVAIAKMKRYKSPSSDQIPAELIQAGGEILRSEIHKLITFIAMRKNCLISGRSLFKRRTIKMIAVIIVGYHCYQLHTKFYPVSFSQG